MRNFVKIILFIITISLNLHAKQAQKVSLQLQWLDQFQFAGYYIAQEKGFYKQANLDVTIKKYKKNINIVKEVTQGKSNFGVGRTSVLIDKQNGYPVVILAAIFQHSPAALLVTNPEIVTANNLINKRIMISPDAAVSASYISMLFSEGIRKKNFTIVPHSYNIQDLIDQKVDAVASYISNEPYLLQKKGIPYKYFHPQDYGYDFYGDLLFTSKKELEQHPQRVEDFTKATLKGWEYAFNHIEETAKLIHKKYNIQNKSVDALIYEGTVLKKLALDEKNRIGHISYKRFEDIVKTYKLLGLLKKEFTLENLLYGVHCLKNITLTNEERTWIMRNKTINLATNQEWIPIEFFNDQNEYSGIAEGYLQLLEKKLDIKFKLNTNLYWHEMIQKMQSNEVDMFMAIVPTANRSKYMNFTTPYLQFPTVIVTKDNIGYIQNVEQLSHKIVAVEKNYYTQELLQKANREIVFKTVNTTKEAIKKVYSGEAFAYVGALPSIGHYIKELKYTNLKINGEVPFKTQLSFGSSKNKPQLNSILQKTLNTITKKEHDAIYSKWINMTYEVKTDKNIIYAVIALCFVILIIFFIRDRILKKELKIKEHFTKKLEKLNTQLEKKNCTLKELSEIDGLTKIANRRRCEELLGIEIKRSYRNKLPLCVVMLDIDYFKKINDTFGHKTGDIVLYEIAQTLQNNLRVYDFIGRWGGEEFLIVCPDSNLQQAYLLCEKLQLLLSNLTIQPIKNHKLTVSCGIAQFDFKEDADDMIKRADDQMYKAKNSGRNTVFPKV